jgi:small subunit ribosomal protein S3
MRANIDYGTARALTSFGVIGVKVWIYKGDLERGERLDFGAQVGGRPGERARAPRRGRLPREQLGLPG